MEPRSIGCEECIIALTDKVYTKQPRSLLLMGVFTIYKLNKTTPQDESNLIKFDLINQEVL